MGSSNNDDLQAGMVSAARDAALAGAERIHDARREFLKLFGFGVEGVDYDADVDADVKVNNLIEM